MDKLKRDCFFECEVQDMAAHIPTCTFDPDSALGHCPCTECKLYISKHDAKNIIREIIRRKVSE